MTSLREQLRALADRDRDLENRRDPIQALADAALRPFVEEGMAIDEERQALLEEHEAQIIGRCEGCEEFILEGDKYQTCDDGPHLCVKCAATWNDIAKQLRERMADPSEREDKLELMESLAHAELMVAAGHGAEPAVS